MQSSNISRESRTGVGGCGLWMLERGCWVVGAGCGCCHVGCGCQVVGGGFPTGGGNVWWIVDCRVMWVLWGVVHWILDCRRWVVGGGRGVVGVR